MILAVFFRFDTDLMNVNLPKTVHCDKGAEMKNYLFKDFCRENFSFLHLCHNVQFSVNLHSSSRYPKKTASIISFNTDSSSIQCRLCHSQRGCFVVVNCWILNISRQVAAARHTAQQRRISASSQLFLPFAGSSVLVCYATILRENYTHTTNL